MRIMIAMILIAIGLALFPLAYKQPPVASWLMRALLPDCCFCPASWCEQR